MNALLMRVGADQSKAGGRFNGPVDTNKFAYAPIPESEEIKPGMERYYSRVKPALQFFRAPLPDNLAGDKIKMHLDPDFEYLTYGDRTKRALRIQTELTPGDLIVFYAGLREVNPPVHPPPRLVYAIIGLYIIDEILLASFVPSSRWDENAHTRRKTIGATDIVVRGKPGVSGRLERCIPIGDFRVPLGEPHKRKSYRVESTLLDRWGGLSNKDGFLQLSGFPPKFLDAPNFYAWFKAQKPRLITVNN
jgi:hypothetical protein